MSADRSPDVDTRYLDGARGLSALAVAVYHATLFTGTTGTMERDYPSVFRFLMHGDLGVTVFIVLSGYVLMLPVARAGGLWFPQGIGTFARRRSRRILPPYLAALGLSLALIALVPVMGRPAGTAWDNKLPVTWDAVLAHLVLVQDLSRDWVIRINGPMWSVAVEWHIYLAMAVLLLPCWRLLGGPATVLLATAGTTAAGLTGLSGPFPHPWFLGSFAMGMLAAELTVRGTRTPRLLAWGPTVAVLALLLLAPWWADAHGTWTELLLSVAVAAWLPRASRAPDAPGCRALRAGPVRELGLMSYSVYLIHSPLLALANLLTLSWDVPTSVRWLGMVLVALPLAIGVAWVFHRLVERRFLTAHQRVAERVPALT